MSKQRVPCGFIQQVSRMQKATVLICIADSTRNQDGTYRFTNIVSCGTGFFINEKGWLLTAGHVLAGFRNGKAIIAYHKHSEAIGTWWFTHTIQHQFPDIDVSAIQFGGLPAWVPLDFGVPEQGAEIGVFGYPASNLTFAPDGSVNGGDIRPRAAKTVVSNREIRTWIANNIQIQGKRMIESQFMFVAGNSGGPVFSATTGKVVGLVNGTTHLCQGVIPIQHTQNTPAGPVPQQSNGFPFAAYSYAIGIDEILRVLPGDLVKHWWK